MATTHEILGDLALSRGTLDRVGHERREPQIVPHLLRDPATRVLDVRGALLPVAAVSDGPALVLRPPDERDADRLVVHLGRDEEGTAYVAAIGPSDESLGPPHWLTLRQLGPALGDRDAGICTTAVALANWHAAHPRCPRCGEPTLPTQAGWVRQCPADESEHYPRTDPAVIMSVLDPDDRLLLGRSPHWPEGQFSVLAGFVEPGESFEAAVAREVAEEVGLALEDMRYLGNQPWPFPSSVMIGYETRTRQTELRLDPTEIAEARWVTRDDYVGLLRRGAIRVPSGISIARRIIEHWLGRPVDSVAPEA
ncbi:MAG TPA: NAD(+) diphosphatase [Intrasporangium sp.]|uniref:NAD(+) diphosphatase n=1 Tax=Intrasporangium sp. TaxID=1925024 RepID=UPI002D78BF42|nr:NAD(+) diphosphatase [Intrasporangium sp.]HET7399608.1 NAD(+) diphosphatase [Intrasporangium sp.]